MKYKAGDYVARHGSVHLKICAAIDGAEPLYGTESPNKPGETTWMTEYSLDHTSHGVSTKVKPDFKLWAKVKAGDLIRISCGKNEEHECDFDSPAVISVIARVDDLVMVSRTKLTKSDLKKNEVVLDAMNEALDHLLEEHRDDPLAEEMLSTGEKLRNDLQRSAEKGSNNSTAWRIESGYGWMTTHRLALMSWELLSE